MQDWLTHRETAEEVKPTLDLSDYKFINQSTIQKIIDKWKKWKEWKYYWTTDIDKEDKRIHIFTDGDIDHRKQSEFAEIKYPLTVMEQQWAQYKKEVMGVLEQRIQLLQENKVPNIDAAMEKCDRWERWIFWFDLSGWWIWVCDYREWEKPVISNHPNKKGFTFVLSKKRVKKII